MDSGLKLDGVGLETIQEMRDSDLSTKVRKTSQDFTESKGDKRTLSGENFNSKLKTAIKSNQGKVMFDVIRRKSDAQLTKAATKCMIGATLN